MTEAYIGSSGITVPIPVGYILNPIKLETSERTLDGTLFTNYAVNSEGTAKTKYHFELPGITQSQRLDIRAAALIPGDISYIDHIRIPEVLSGAYNTRKRTLLRPLASTSDVPVITVDGNPQTVTVKDYDLDVGSPAIDRGSFFYSGGTFIVAENPATFTGKITYIEIHACLSGMGGVTVATFTQVSDNVFTARDSYYIGDVGGYFKRSFVVDLDVVAGDKIGIHWTFATIEKDNFGSGIWLKSGNQTACSGVTFGFSDNITISLYASENVPAGNVYVSKVTGSMYFGTIPADTIGNIIVKYVPKYMVHVISDTHELLFKTSSTDHVTRYNLVLEEV